MNAVLDTHNQAIRSRRRESQLHSTHSSHQISPGAVHHFPCGALIQAAVKTLVFLTPKDGGKAGVLIVKVVGVDFQIIGLSLFGESKGLTPIFRFENSDGRRLGYRADSTH